MYYKSSNSEFPDLVHVCKQMLNQNAPCKQKHARGNQMTFMIKVLSKELRDRTQLGNKVKNKTKENKRK